MTFNSNDDTVRFGKNQNDGGQLQFYMPGNNYMAPYNGGNWSYLTCGRENATGTCGLFLRTYNAGTLKTSVTVTGDGKVGVGTTTPTDTLHVNGTAKLTPQASAPASPTEGTIYYDSTLNKLRCYDGTAWQNCW